MDALADGRGVKHISPIGEYICFLHLGKAFFLFNLQTDDQESLPLKLPPSLREGDRFSGGRSIKQSSFKLSA